jgi:hypothetical protein
MSGRGLALLTPLLACVTALATNTARAQQSDRQRIEAEVLYRVASESDLRIRQEKAESENRSETYGRWSGRIKELTTILCDSTGRDHGYHEPPSIQRVIVESKLLKERTDETAGDVERRFEAMRGHVGRESCSDQPGFEAQVACVRDKELLLYLGMWKLELNSLSIANHEAVLETYRAFLCLARPAMKIAPELQREMDHNIYEAWKDYRDRAERRIDALNAASKPMRTNQ